jgi:hypothetical protein
MIDDHVAITRAIEPEIAAIRAIETGTTATIIAVSEPEVVRIGVGIVAVTTIGVRLTGVEVAVKLTIKRIGINGIQLIPLVTTDQEEIQSDSVHLAVGIVLQH